MSDMPRVGEQAPGFSLVDQDENVVVLQELMGQPVVLYFYPKDDTPGCTKEACSFRDAWSEFQAAGAVVLGVSPDSVESHRKFREKYNLPFQLLSDPDHETAEEYGAWGTKKMYGREFEGIIRSTFVIGDDGEVKKIFPKVTPADHAEEVLAAVRELKSNN